MRNLILTAALGLTGCSAGQFWPSTLQPTDTIGVFRWVTFADNLYPPNDPAAEEARMSELAKIMARNPPCDGGYRVTNRSATLKQASAVGAGVYDVFYTVDCR